MIYKTTYQSPIGLMTLASDGINLIGLWNFNQKYHGEELFVLMKTNDDLMVFKQTKNLLNQYFLGENPDFSKLSLKPVGSEFRQLVWKILCEVPYGQTITYGQIGKMVAKMTNKKSMSAQAIGGAVGHNPISVIIPCHRVVGTNGSLTGYAGGMEMKKWLLNNENVELSHFFEPNNK